jgi:hypothetical protein
MKRKPSLSRLAAGLERAAAQAEVYAAKLRETGDDNNARAVAAAAAALSYAATKTRERA